MWKHVKTHGNTSNSEINFQPQAWFIFCKSRLWLKISAGPMTRWHRPTHCIYNSQPMCGLHIWATMMFTQLGRPDCDGPADTVFLFSADVRWPECDGQMYNRILRVIRERWLKGLFIWAHLCNWVLEWLNNHMGPSGINTGSLGSTYPAVRDPILLFRFYPVGG